MPIREYQCKSCGNTYERIEYKETFQWMGCLKCGSTNVKRLISVPATPKCKGEGCYKKSS